MKTILKQLNKGIAILITVIMFVCSMNLGSSADTYSVNTTRSYNVYDAKTGALIDEYTLEPNSYPVSNSANCRGVIGTDDRNNDTYISGVVRVDTNWKIGSGFIVDDHVIATAAHCVWNGTSVTSRNNMLMHCIYIYDANGTKIRTISEDDIVEVHVPRAYINNYSSSSNDPNPYDYALITVSDTLTDISVSADNPNEKCTCLDLGIMREEFKGSNQVVSATGFPDIVNNIDVAYDMYTGTGNILADQGGWDSSRLICHNIDTSSGNSGGPVYITTQYGGKEYRSVIGIVTCTQGSYNVAVRMTTDLIHFYKNNSYICY